MIIIIMVIEVAVVMVLYGSADGWDGGGWYGGWDGGGWYGGCIGGYGSNSTKR